MRVSIDSSVQSKGVALGVLNGKIETPSIPQIGSKISFLSPNEGSNPPKCNLILSVENVIFSPTGINNTSVSILLENLILESEDELEIAAHYFREGFDLHIDTF